MQSLLHTAISSDEYNKIPLYSAIANINQTPELHRQLHYLESLGDIFIRHGVENQWGAHLLHRHFSIPAGTTVVYNVVDPKLDLCNVVPNNELVNARPRAYLLSKSSQFQAYEFESGPGVSNVDPPAAFLAELASFLNDAGLGGVVALSKERADEHCRTREEYLFNGQSTVSLRHVDVAEHAVISTRHGSQYIGQSGWSFARGIPKSLSSAAENLLLTSVASDGTPFSIYTVASHIHKELDMQDSDLIEKEIMLADNSVRCTHENVRKVVAEL